MAAGDKAFLKTLDRFDSPAALAKAYKELTTKLSAGELRAVRPPAADATPEQVAAWRTAHGLPENAEAYVGGLVLGDGVLAGEANGPMLLSFAQAALAGNWSGEQYSQAVRWYFATQDQLLTERQRADGVFKHATARDLAREWGNDYDVNRNTVVQFCDRHFAQDLKIDLLNARTPDGSLLANHPGFNRAILAVARTVDPRGALLPNASGAGVSGVESRIAEIEGKMRAPHGSDSWKTYWTGNSGSRMQQEYRGLLAAREQARGLARFSYHWMVMAGLVPATSLILARPCPTIGVAGTSPAMTSNDRTYRVTIADHCALRRAATPRTVRLSDVSGRAALPDLSAISMSRKCLRVATSASASMAR